ncbi:MAG: hypothetical protein NVV60_01470 [Luteimonas sp.]|nr:hypothetical protein [Luteimonas sp.]
MDSDRRAEINQAWVEGRSAGRQGASRGTNPYIGDAPLAKAWDAGWQEGHNT